MFSIKRKHLSVRLPRYRNHFFSTYRVTPMIKLCIQSVKEELQSSGRYRIIIDFLFSFCIPAPATPPKGSGGKSDKKMKINNNPILAAVIRHEQSE